MRFWQNFRDPRTAAAMLSAILAFVYAIIDLRGMFADALAGVRSNDPVMAGTLVVGIVGLAGAVVTLRRGNLVFLLVAWAFILGNRFVAIVRFFDEMTSAGGNFALAVVSANVDVILVVIGAALAFLSTALRRRKAKAT